MPKKMTFEESVQKLEEIVRAMERGEAPLDESLKLYQEGTELVQICTKLLEDAEIQIKKISVGSDGSPVEEVFEFEQ